MIAKRDGMIDWNKPARAVHDHARGMTPWPGAFTFAPERICVHRTRVHDASARPGAPPGTVVGIGADAIVVACETGAVALLELQRESKRKMDAATFVRGLGWAVGKRLGEESGA